MKSQAYHGYYLKWIPIQEMFSIEKEGFHIGWASSLDDAKEKVDMLASGNPCGRSTPEQVRRAVGGTRSRSRMAKKNPSLVIYNPPREKVKQCRLLLAETMSLRVHELRYEHVEDGENYYHPFGKGVEMIAVVTPKGEKQILLRHTGGKPLWEDFD